MDYNYDDYADLQNWWYCPPDPDRVRKFEDECGPLANTLTELAEIVRETNRIAEEDYDFTDRFSNLMVKARASLAKLRSKVEMVIGSIQAEAFYDELVGTLWFYVGDAVGQRWWCGGEGKAESLAKRLEKWHANLLLLIQPENSQCKQPAWGRTLKDALSRLRSLNKRKFNKCKQSANESKLKVDEVLHEITFNGKTHKIRSDRALHLVSELLKREGKWTTSTELISNGAFGDGARVDRYRKKLPKDIQKLIKTDRQKGFMLA